MINQGDIYWVDLGDPVGSGPAYRRPQVVIQNNQYNHGRIKTVVICSVTTNLRRANVGVNVLLDEGEASLPEQSVVVVSQLFTVDKSELEEYIGALSSNRVHQILDGIRLLTEPREID